MISSLQLHRGTPDTTQIKGEPVAGSPIVKRKIRSNLSNLPAGATPPRRPLDADAADAGNL